MAAPCPLNARCFATAFWLARSLASHTADPFTRRLRLPKATTAPGWAPSCSRTISACHHRRFWKDDIFRRDRSACRKHGAVIYRPWQSDLGTTSDFTSNHERFNDKAVAQPFNRASCGGYLPGPGSARRFEERGSRHPAWGSMFPPYLSRNSGGQGWRTATRLRTGGLVPL